MDLKARQLKKTSSPGVKTDRSKKEQVLYKPATVKTSAYPRVSFDTSVVDRPLAKMGKDSLTNGVGEPLAASFSEDVKDIETCFEIMTRLAQKKTFSQTKKIVAEYGKLQTTKEVLLETNASQRDTINKLGSDNEKQRKNIDLLEKKADELQNQLNKEREISEKKLKQLEADSERMKRLDSLFATTTKVTSLREITSHLDTIFNSAHKLVSNSFSDDLPETVINAEDWKVIRKNFSRQIPLPASNTQDAKHMRVAAVLSCLSELACDMLFQPVYLSGDNDGIGKLLDDAGLDKAEEAEKAKYLRRLLLNMYRDNQESHAESRALKVSKAMKKAVADILSPKQLETFTAELEVWSKDTAKTWLEHIQPLEHMVVGDFSTNTAAYWEAMPTIDEEDAIEDSKEAKTTNGAGQNGKPKSLKNGDLRVAIWPMFCWIEKDQFEIVRKGVALTMAQTKKADEAIKAAEALEESTRRNSRAIQRHSRQEAMSKK